jgi:hypothetical protein
MVGNLRKRDRLKDPDVSVRIILRWIFRKWDGGTWTGLIWFRIGTGGEICKFNNVSSGSIKCGKFLE